jgi:hypothetical protein
VIERKIELQEAVITGYFKPFAIGVIPIFHPPVLFFHCQ